MAMSLASALKAGPVHFAGQERRRWNFVNAWPTKWDGPDFNAEGNDIAIETLELAHEGVTRA